MSSMTKRGPRVLTGTLLVTGIGLASTASASMGNIGTTYGVFPTDVATAQALSMFNSQVSANYYNPAAMVKDERGELTSGILHAEQELRAAGPARQGDVLANDPSQHVLLGMKTNVSSLLRGMHPLHLGFVVGVEKYGKEMLAFGSRTSEEGQFLQYGREPLFLNIGGGTRLWRGISGGFASRITLESTARLDAVSTLGGETRQESLAVEAEPSIRAIIGLNVDWGQTLCPDGCSLSGFESALAFRNSSAASTTVDSNVVVDQTIPDPGLNLAVSTIDSYQPEIYSVATQYKGDGWRAGATLEHQRWSGLEDEFRGDTIKDQQGVANRIQFDDTLIPRIGAELDLSPRFTLLTGLAYEESPLESTRSPQLNYFDNDRISAGLGLSATYERSRIFTHPVRFDIGYQYQQLQERDFVVTDFDGNTENVTTDGDIHIISGSLTLKF